MAYFEDIPYLKNKLRKIIIRLFPEFKILIISYHSHSIVAGGLEEIS